MRATSCSTVGASKGRGRSAASCFREHRLFPWLTVDENIALGLDAGNEPMPERQRRTAENIALVGLAGFERAYPYQLSGGMAQRAAIARSLVSRPEILLLDEPLGALDSLTRAYLQGELLRIWRQERVTMIMVTHDVEEAIYLSDKVVVMERGPAASAPSCRSTWTIRASARRWNLVTLKERVIRELTP